MESSHNCARIRLRFEAAGDKVDTDNAEHVAAAEDSDNWVADGVQSLAAVEGNVVAVDAASAPDNTQIVARLQSEPLWAH